MAVSIRRPFDIPGQNPYDEGGLPPSGPTGRCDTEPGGRTGEGTEPMFFEFVLIHLLPTLGFVLALLLLAHILRERRSPTSTLAWLMAVVFVPYAAVPLYIMIGGRKLSRRGETKPMLHLSSPIEPADEGLEYQLASLGYRGGFAPTRRNRLSLLLTGEDAFHETLRMIEAARRSVHVSTYVLSRDATGRAIVDALVAKASGGLEVRLLMDALGCVKVDRRFLAPLHRAGGRTAFFMPMLHLPFRGRANLRNHRKMVLVDGKTAVIGGMNLAGEYMGPAPAPERWADIALRIAGPAVQQAFEIFRSDWAFAAKEELSRPPLSGEPADGTAATALQIIASGPDVENDALREALMISLFRAHRRVWIVTPYFVPDDLLLEALCLAARRGIDLRVILPNRSNHRLADMAREGYLSELQEAGAGIFLYRPRMLHAKALLIDDTVAVTGSANMDMRSLLLNFEVGVCIYSNEIIGYLEDWMHEMMAESIERKPHDSMPLSVVEGVGRLFAPLL